MLAWVDREDRALAAEYEAFVERRGSFFQSLAWGEVKENWRAQALLSRGEDGGIRAAALALIRPLPLVGGSLLYCPRGPVGEWSDRAALGDLTEGFARLAERERACLLKLDPLVAPGGPEAALLQSAGFRHRPGEGDYRTLQPRFGYLLPLADRGEEELLAGFSQKCRYNLRRAIKKGVECRMGGAEELDAFYPLLEETGRRDGFVIRPRAYLEQLLRAFGPARCRLFLCRWQGRPVSGALALRYGQTATYLYGASSGWGREAMPNYLMQWEMIRWALAGGCAVYDFGAVPHFLEPSHPAYGIYRFKKGFDGRVAEWAGEFDWVYRPVSAALLRGGQRGLQLAQAALRAGRERRGRE